MATIIGIKLEDRNLNSVEFQKLLTEHGCQIKTRIGLHEVENSTCSTFGVVLLDVIGETSDLENKLHSFGEVQTMRF
ncbi:hypothetical protein IJF81_06700 [bacterium]|nr:hypothetical protein [bacterium]